MASNSTARGDHAHHHRGGGGGDDPSTFFNLLTNTTQTLILDESLLLSKRTNIFRKGKLMGSPSPRISSGALVLSSLLQLSTTLKQNWVLVWERSRDLVEIQNPEED